MNRNNFYLELIKALIKILFSSNFGMQISAKIWDHLKKIIKIKIPFENSKEHKFFDFTYIEIILPISYKNIDKDTIFIKFWNANIGKNLGLLRNIIKI